MLPDDMLVGQVWHHPQQTGHLARSVACNIAHQGRRNGWHIARVWNRSWQRFASADEAQAAGKWFKTIGIRYRATYEEMQAVLERAKDGRCRICLQPATLVVDHCHETLRVRGMLCGLCNTAIGAMRDDPARLRRAADYVEHYQKRSVAPVERSVAG